MEQNVEKDEFELDLGELFVVILSKLWFIIVLGILFGVSALILTKLTSTSVYRSTAKILVDSRQDVDANGVYKDTEFLNQLTEDCADLVKSGTVLTKVLSDLQLDLSAEGLSNMIEVGIPTGARIITITVKSGDEYQAQEIANAVSQEASRYISDAVNHEEFESVKVLAKVLDEASTQSFSSNVTKNTMLGVIVGMFLAVAVIMVMFFLDDTLKKPDDIERYLELSVLGSIPILNGRKNISRTDEWELEDDAEEE